MLAGFRGAALNQSRSASGVYTGLVCYDGVRVQESASCGRRKMQQRSVSRICDTGYIPLPRSLTRCARSFGCGERYQLTGGAEISWEMPGRSNGEAIRPRQKPFFHRLRPLTSITESDAQISGGETRCGLKIPGVSPWWLPRAPPHSCLSVYRCHSAVMAAVSHSTPDTQFREGSSLQDGLYARTPVQSDRCALSGNYQLESNPERHD